MKRVLVYGLAIGALLASLAYAVDYVLLRIRIARSSGYGSVTVRQFYAINEKNNRTEYVYGSTLDETCVNSLFGHQGLNLAGTSADIPNKRFGSKSNAFFDDLLLARSRLFLQLVTLPTDI